MSSSEPLLEVGRLTAGWEGVPVLNGVSFSLAPRELFVLLGPNGSGKTTLLRCLAGLERPWSGTIRLEGAEVGGLPPHRRRIGLMSQDAALFPGRTVLENIAYAPLLKGHDERTAREEVRGLIDLLRLEGFEDRRPDQLSGGERQRVALARTLAARPAVVLLDEPFASIDVGVRAELRADFRRVLRVLGTAAIHVTHDREEGLFLGDRIGLLFDGRLENVGSAREVFDHPATPRAARLLGYNVLREQGRSFAVHPSDVVVGPDAPATRDSTVLAAGSTGRERLLVVALSDGQRAEVRSAEPQPTVAAGDRVRIGWTRATALGEERIAVSSTTPAPKEPKRRSWLHRS